MDRPCVIIVMGVSGSGKTTIGAALAKSLDWRFHDADDDHQPHNVQQMRRGVPLTDEQRRPWLDLLSRRVRQWLSECQPTVLACSALTRDARAVLHNDDPRVVLVYLRGPSELIRRRMDARDHFMPPSLLESQFQLLQEPAYEESAITIDAADPPDVIVRRIRDELEPRMNTDAQG
jgi:gluconokinase